MKLAFLEINNISFKYKMMKDYLIEDFSLSLEKNKLLAIVGSSGCGKSTLLRIIAGLEESDKGSIIIDNNTVFSKNIFVEPEKRNVGMVFQDYALFPHMSVYKNIKYAVHRLSKKERKEKVFEVIEMVGLKDHYNKYPYELSGGQQQRVALARSIAQMPSLLLLDEPFSNLDADLKNQIREDVKNIIDNAGITSILVTHDIEDAKYLADNILNME